MLAIFVFYFILFLLFYFIILFCITQGEYIHRLLTSCTTFSIYITRIMIISSFTFVQFIFAVIILCSTVIILCSTGLLQLISYSPPIIFQSIEITTSSITDGKSTNQQQQQVYILFTPHHSSVQWQVLVSLKMQEKNTM